MNTLTIKEGILRYLDGEDVTVMTPAKMNELTVEDLQMIFDQGGFCIRTKELNRKPETELKEFPDNDGGTYTMKVPVEEQKPDPEPEPEPEPAKKKVDAGKIRALAAAGRSVQWIAKDMGLSAPTARKCLNGD